MINTYNTKEFGSYMKKIRKTLCISHRVIENTTNISRDTVRRIERGEVVPRYETLIKLSSIYRCDLIKLFHETTENHTIINCYNAIDLAIITGEHSYLESYYKNMNNVIGNQAFDDNHVDPTEAAQFIIFYDTLQLMTDDLNGNAKKIIMDMERLLSMRHTNFNLTNLKKIHYSFIELRSLLLFALALTDKNPEQSIDILLFLEQKLEENRMCNNYKLQLKVLLNLSYNHYLVEQDTQSMIYANKGIELTTENNTTYLLPDFLFRKGVALRYLDDATESQKYLTQALNLCEILNLDKLKDEMILSMKKVHGIPVSV